MFIRHTVFVFYMLKYKQMMQRLRRLISKTLIGFFVLFFTLSPMFNLVDTTFAQTYDENGNVINGANTTQPDTAAPSTTFNAAKDSQAANAPSVGGENVDPTTAAGKTAAAAAANKTAEKTPCTAESAFQAFFNNINPAHYACLATFWVMKLIITIAGGLTYLSTKLFDISVEKFILKISSLFGDTNSENSGIYSAWKVVRDMANIAGFFGAIYAGLMYIIGRTDNLKKIFVNLLMFAILTNFSFPIAKFAIDIANVVSLNVYGSMTSTADGQYHMEKGLGDALMGKLGLSLFVTNEKTIDQSAIGNNLSSWTVSFLLIIYLLFAVFIFMEAALFVLTRGLTLVIYVIFSPLMFIGGLAPFLSEMHKKWRENFVGAVLVGPILMILLWVAFKILDAVKTLSSIAGIRSVTGDAGAETLVSSSLVLIFSGLALHYAIKMAKEYSHEAGSLVSGVMSGVGTLAGAAVTGGASMALRGTVGRAGAAMAESKWVKEGAESGGFMRRMASRGVGNTGNAMTKANGKFAGATFTKTFNAGLGANATNMNVGKSYKDVKDEATRKEFEDAGGKRGLELAQEKAVLVAKHESISAPNNSRDNVNTASSSVLMRASADLAEVERKLKEKKESPIEYTGKEEDVKGLELEAAGKQASFAKVNAKAESINNRLEERATENKNKVAEKEVAYAKVQEKNADIQRAKELRAKLAGVKAATPATPAATA